MSDPHTRNVAVAFGALAASSATLVCCVLPAVFVSIGAGAALAGIVSAAPQLIWLSEHKVAVFLTAAVLLLVSGVLLWNGRRLACPADPRLAKACVRLRKVSGVTYAVAVTAFSVGVVFAFLLPLI
jgi:uncharacterized membrane protein YjjP (DUF1212 family)